MDKIINPPNDGNKEKSLGSKIRELIGTYFIAEFVLVNVLLPMGIYQSTKNSHIQCSYDQREKQARELFANDPYLSSKLGDAIFAATWPGRRALYTIEQCLNNKQQ